MADLPTVQGLQRCSTAQHMDVFEVEHALEALAGHRLEARVEPDGLTELRGLYAGTKRA